MASVASRVFAITGGASGIGAATARLLAHRGASGICVGDISNQHFGNLEEAIRRINPSTKLLCTVLDVTSSAEVDRWIQSVIATFGNLHGAANIAGIAQGGGMRETPTILLEKDEEWHKIIRTNLDGIFYATRAEVRAMNDPLRSSLDRSIVNVGSIAGMYHEPDVYAYGTSKGACSYFTKCVAKDVFPSGIRVNNVSPGITMTPLLPHFNPKAKTIDEVKELYVKEGFSLLQPDDVARTIVWLLSEDSRPVHGADINVGATMP